MWESSYMDYRQIKHIFPNTVIMVSNLSFSSISCDVDYESQDGNSQTLYPGPEKKLHMLCVVFL